MKNKIKILNIILFILCIIAIILIAYISKIYMERAENEKNIKDIISSIEKQVENTEQQEEIPYINYKGYQVIGTIQIPKINLKYPILNETSDEAMNTSIIKFAGKELNKIGNITLAGHNYINGIMFGHLDKLELEDEIQIFDLHGNIVKYRVFNKYITNPDDINALNSVENNKKEITLITCIHGKRDRLILKAREK